MIVDASVVLRWFLNEPGADDAARVFQQQSAPDAPDFVLAEIANGLWSAVRQKRIGDDVANRFVDGAPLLFDTLHPTSSLHSRAFSLALELDHPIYDCLYLALADRERRPLLTGDMRLQNKVANTPWTNLVSVLTP
jgi:predicted nucleic acid-binding protein